MKTKIIRTALFISLFALSFGCDNNADLSGDLSQDINAKDQATQQVYPVEIQATDFSLPEGCGWKSPAKGEPDIYVIRSVEDILPLIDGEF
ncbi:MAG: hypothetical protein LBJ17_08770, partial [Dysgonamonadaceae bacterium]|nr:hypothetical protein [Dysgonamonadaceae bacterium]